jgi:hypothetical protein
MFWVSLLPVAVGREPEPHTLLEHVVEAHASAAELAVAGRIVHHDGAARGGALDVVVGQPDAVRHRQAIGQNADLVEMTDRAHAEQTLALEKLALGFADVHMDHGVELDRRLLALLELFHGAAMRRRWTDDRQHQVGAATNRFGELDKVLQRLRAFEPRNALDFLARGCGQAAGIEADGRLVLLVRQRQRQAAAHAGICHRRDDIQSAHVRQRRAGVKVIHHAGASGADHLDDAKLRADIDRFVRSIRASRRGYIGARSRAAGATTCL